MIFQGSSEIVDFRYFYKFWTILRGPSGIHQNCILYNFPWIRGFIDCAGVGPMQHLQRPSVVEAGEAPPTAPIQKGLLQKGPMQKSPICESPDFRKSRSSNVQILENPVFRKYDFRNSKFSKIQTFENPKFRLQKGRIRNGPFKRALFGRISIIGSNPFYTGSPSNLFGKPPYTSKLLVILVSFSAV